MGFRKLYAMNMVWCSLFLFPMALKSYMKCMDSWKRGLKPQKFLLSKKEGNAKNTFAIDEIQNKETTSYHWHSSLVLPLIGNTWVLGTDFGVFPPTFPFLTARCDQVSSQKLWQAQITAWEEKAHTRICTRNTGISPSQMEDLTCPLMKCLSLHSLIATRLTLMP